MSEKDIHFGAEYLNDERNRLKCQYGFSDQDLDKLEAWLEKTIGYTIDCQKACFMTGNSPERIKEIIGEMK